MKRFGVLGMIIQPLLAERMDAESKGPTYSKSISSREKPKELFLGNPMSYPLDGNVKTDLLLSILSEKIQNR